MTKQNNSGSGDWGWILILILLATVWPVGLLALFSKLFGSNSKQAAPPPLGQTRTSQASRMGQQTAQQGRPHVGQQTEFVHRAAQQSADSVHRAAQQSADSVRRAAQQSADSVRRAAQQSADSAQRTARQPADSAQRTARQPVAPVRQTARQQSQWRQSAKQTRASQKRTARAVKQMTKPPKLKRSNAFLLKLCGVFLSVFGILGMVNTGADALFWEFEEFRFWLPVLLRFAALTVGGWAMLFSGLSMDRQLKRYSKYLLVMGDREAMPIEELSRTLGFSERRVEKDLQKMIDKGYFGGKAYLNVELGYLSAAAPQGNRSGSRIRPRTPPNRRKRPMKVIPVSSAASAGPTTVSRTLSFHPKSTVWRKLPRKSSGPWRKTLKRPPGSIPS